MRVAANFSNLSCWICVFISLTMWAASMLSSSSRSSGTVGSILISVGPVGFLRPPNILKLITVVTHVDFTYAEMSEPLWAASLAPDSYTWAFILSLPSYDAYVIPFFSSSILALVRPMIACYSAPISSNSPFLKSFSSSIILSILSKPSSLPRSYSLNISVIAAASLFLNASLYFSGTLRISSSVFFLKSPPLLLQQPMVMCRILLLLILIKSPLAQPLNRSHI